MHEQLFFDPRINADSINLVNNLEERKQKVFVISPRHICESDHDLVLSIINVNPIPHWYLTPQLWIIYFDMDYVRANASKLRIWISVYEVFSITTVMRIIYALR